MPNISLFGDIYDINAKDNFPLDAYLIEVRDGRWEDLIYTIRNKKNDADKDKIKDKANRVTFSGMFSKRNDAGLIEHSGYIAIDLDDLEDVENTKAIIIEDRFVYSAFTSAGGKGLTVLFKIRPKKHRESFLGISEYLLNNYGLIPDPQSISVSKPFCVTFDPFLYIAEKEPPTWTHYPQEKKVEKIPNFSFVQTDFTEIIKTIISRNINMCENYDEWLKIGFAFAHKFGESGRDYYHLISKISPKYNHRITEKQYSYCLRAKSTTQISTIATFYYYCKEHGLQIQSERTAKIRKATINSKAAGLSKKQIVENLKKFENIEGVDKIVEEIFDGTADVGEGDSLLEQLEMFISANYAIERNEITRFLEMGNRTMEQKDLNTIFILGKKTMSDLKYDLLERLLMSDFIKGYNPIKRFFENLPFKNIRDIYGELYTPNIDKMASTIINDIQPYTEYFFKKWIVSSIAAVYGEHTPLLFVLVGERHGTGKTEWFRRMLPPKLKRFYAESKLDAGKDDEILMCQKWFIMDDEMSGKSKREEQRLKELTSKQWFSLREPYGRMNTDLLRLAVLCATTNSRGILRDTENRRIIPIPVDDINKDLYNTIDKTELFSEAYHLWKDGFEWRILSKDDLAYLRKYEIDFQATVIERELLLTYFSCEKPDVYLTSSEIKVELDKMTMQRLSLDQLGKQLGKCGFERKAVREKSTGQSIKKWGVKRVNRSGYVSQEEKEDHSYSTKEKTDGYRPMDDEAPF